MALVRDVKPPSNPVLVQFALAAVVQSNYAEGVRPTPKAFANFSPGLLQPWDPTKQKKFNAESVGQYRGRERLQRWLALLCETPGLKQPSAEISERLRRIFKLNHYE